MNLKLHYQTHYAQACKDGHYGFAQAIAALYFKEWGEPMPKREARP